MARPDLSGRDIVKALTKQGFVIVGRTGSHVKLRYEHPNERGDVRIVSVPQHDRVRIGTLQTIANQCGAKDFQAWCDWIDDLL